MWSRGLLALLLVVAGLLTGCNDREPLPVHVVVIRAEGAGFLLDGQSMAQDQVLTELATLAQRNRTSPGGSARMVLTIRTDSGVPYDRVVEMIEQCTQLGINKIETGVR